jgi:phage protein D
MPESIYKTRPELTQNQVNSEQKKVARQAGQFEYATEVDMRGDVNCNPTKQLQLTGTGTAFDQTYDIMSVTHRISTAEGYRMTIIGHSGSSAGGGGGDGGGGGGGGG